MVERAIVFRCIYDAMQKMADEEFGAFAKAYLCYAFDGKDADLKEYPRADALFPIAKELIDQTQKVDGRKNKDYREWRKQVFVRDNYTCQMCGETDKPLNAHHIMRYADYPHLRYEVDNGITLCEDCHKLVHWRERNG